MPAHKISLSVHHDRFVDALVASGRYKNASDVVRKALHLLERQVQTDAAILAGWRADVAVGTAEIERGDFIELELDEIGPWLSSLGRTTPV